jgi:hypothetical protein
MTYEPEGVSNNQHRTKVLTQLFDSLTDIIEDAEDFQYGFGPDDLNELHISRNSISYLMKRTK